MKRLFVSTLMVGALILPAAAFAQTEGEAPAPAEAPAATPEKAEEAEDEKSKAKEPKAEEPAAEPKAEEPATEAKAEEPATEAKAEEPAAETAEPKAVEPAPAEPAPVSVEPVPVETATTAAAKADAAAAAATAAAAAAAAAAAQPAVVAEPAAGSPAVATTPDPAVVPEETVKKADAAGGAVTAEATDKDKKKAKADDTLAATMGTNAPTAGGKPWQVAASLSQSLGAGVLVSNPNQRDVLYGYSGRINGAYKILPLLDGRLDVTGRITFDQLLTNSFIGGLGDSAPRQFNFRDIRVGLNGRGLIQEKTTGIILGANTSLDLPTGPIARAEKRIFRWNLGVNAFKAFPNVGPGTVTLFWAEIFRKNAGPVQATLRDGASEGAAQCFASQFRNRTAEDACLSGRASENFGLIHSLGAGYIVGSFSFNVSFALVNLFRYPFDESDTSNIGDGNLEVGQGVGSTDTTHIAFTSGSVSVGYVLNANVNFSAGMSTLQEQFIQSRTEDGGGRKLRFPWFDLDSTASSRTSFFLSANFLY